MKKLEINQNLSCHSACDYNTIFTGKVISRTEKTATIAVECFGIKRVKIFKDENGEYVYPLGRYSMCPIFRA